jgi:hypothetical protein
VIVPGQIILGDCREAMAFMPDESVDAMAAGRLHSGDKVVLAGIGAGFSFAALCMLEWTGCCERFSLVYWTDFVSPTI